MSITSQLHRKNAICIEPQCTRPGKSCFARAQFNFRRFTFFDVDSCFRGISVSSILHCHFESPLTFCIHCHSIGAEKISFYKTNWRTHMFRIFYALAKSTVQRYRFPFPYANRTRNCALFFFLLLSFRCALIVFVLRLGQMQTVAHEISHRHTLFIANVSGLVVIMNNNCQRHQFAWNENNGWKFFANEISSAYSRFCIRFEFDWARRGDVYESVLSAHRCTVNFEMPALQMSTHEVSTFLWLIAAYFCEMSLPSIAVNIYWCGI